MNASLNILIVEVALVSFILVSVVGFFIWKQKKARTAEFEHLLENVTNHQDERKAQLTQLLIKKYGVEADEANESGGYMVEAEKQFLQQFIKQQLEQTAVTDFYGNLTELLDQYLYFVPQLIQEKKIDDNQEVSVAEIESSTEANSAEDTDQHQEQEKSTNLIGRNRSPPPLKKGD